MAYTYGIGNLQPVNIDVEIRFFQSSIDEASKHRSDQIRSYVRGLPESDFDPLEKLKTSELIAAKFQFVNMPEFATDQIRRGDPVFRQGSDQVTIAVYFPVNGDVSLFQLFHRFRPVSPPPPVFEYRDNVLTKMYVLEKQRLDAIDQLVDNDLKLVEEHYKPVREIVAIFNESLLSVASDAFEQRVRELDANKRATEKLARSRFALHKRADGTEEIIVPIRHKPIVLVQSPEAVSKIREYALAIHEYEDILKTISSMVRVMERSPSVFASMDEESLRTILLVALNGIYEGQATGETFNGHGKTDILIRRDDRNVFIAECLIWRGQAYLRDKMNDQLFQYAMWRDSKLALIVFNRGASFTHSVETMKTTVKNHPQCIREQDWSHETGARYLFRRHDDPERNFLLTALAFDVPAVA